MWRGVSYVRPVVVRACIRTLFFRLAPHSITRTDRGPRATRPVSRGAARVSGVLPLWFAHARSGRALRLACDAQQLAAPRDRYGSLRSLQKNGLEKIDRVSVM